MKSLSIQSRILFAALLPATAIVALLSFYFVHSRISDLENTLLNRGRIIASQLAPAAEYGVFSGNITILNSLAQSALREKDVIRVAIHQSNGAVLVDASKPLNLTIKSQDTVSFEAEILPSRVPVDDFEESPPETDNTPLGYVYVELTKHDTLKIERQILTTSLGTSLLVLLMGAIFARRISLSVSKPLKEITSVVEQIGNGALDARINRQSKGELGTLEQGVNTMADTIQNAQQKLQQQVDEATSELRETLEAVEIQNVELDLARKRALQASSDKTEFLANMSHEIRTPMNGLLGFIDLLLRTPLNSEQRDYTTTIRKSATNLLVIVNDILDFSKIESRKLVTENAPYDLREALEDSIDLMSHQAHEKGLELVLLIYTDVPMLLYGDSNRVRQVLLNLIGNAIKFSSEGSIVVRVMLEDTDIMDNRASIRISVTDTGIGLSEEQKSQLFIAFSQVDSSPSRKHGGTGLGLFISKKLVEMMGGTIGAESEPGKGSTFWFTLNCPLQDDTTHDNPEPPAPYPATVLLYDSHPLARLATRHLLSSWSLSVIEVDTQSNLIETLEYKSPGIDLIVAGLNYNESETAEAAGLIHKLSGYGIPIIIQVSALERDYLRSLCELGATACLSKPTRREHLRRTTWKTLGWRESEQGPLVDRRRSPRPPMPNLTGTRILVADDNEINRRLIELQLESLGVCVDKASSGEEAIKLARQSPYDLIFMDIHMPGMSGDEATQRIRQQCQRNQETPIIAITANVFTGEQERLSEAGLDDCLIKPISEYRLWEVVKRWIGKKASARHITIKQDIAQDDDLKQQVRQDLLYMFLKELPELLQQLSEAFEQNNWEALREIAHKLHGSAAYCQLRDLQVSCKDLEQSAYEKQEMEIENNYVKCNAIIRKLLEERSKH